MTYPHVQTWGFILHAAKTETFSCAEYEPEA